MRTLPHPTDPQKMWGGGGIPPNPTKGAAPPLDSPLEFFAIIALEARGSTGYRVTAR